MEHPLLQFCTTEKQAKVIILAEIEGLSQYDIARELGLSRSTVRDHIRAVKAKAQTRGYSPEHDWTNPVPDGHKIKGVSTFYDEDGKPVRQWVKSQTDEQRQFEILVERLESAQENLTRFKPTPPPKSCDENL
ncbi:MAG: helix-turn-helix transcriptional regulator, partial [Acidimicrobiales bacterium]